MRTVAIFDLASLNSLAHRRGLDDLQAVGRDQCDAGGPSRRMAGSPGTLQHSRHALGRADLQHALDGQEVDAQIQAGSADDGAQGAILQSQFHPISHGYVERPMMQRNLPSPIRIVFQQRLVPALCL